MTGINLTQGPLLPKMMAFAIPYLLACFLQTFYGMADLFITGLFNGAAPITAAGRRQNSIAPAPKSRYNSARITTGDAHADRHHRRARHGDDRLHQPRGGRQRSEGSLLLHRKLGAALCPLQPR